MFFIIIALAIIAAVVLLLLLRINLIIEARVKNWSLSVRTLGSIILRRRYEVRREFGDFLTLYSVDKNEKRIISIIDIVKSLQRTDKKSDENGRRHLFGFVNSKSKYEIIIQIKVGLEDAFLTAVSCGLINSVIGSLMVRNVDERHIVRFSAIPVFQKRSFSFHGDCIITLSLANIIIGYIIYKINKRR